MVFRLFSFPWNVVSRKLCNLMSQSCPINFSPFGYKNIPSLKQPDICSSPLSPSSLCNYHPFWSFGSNKISHLQATVQKLKTKFLNRRPQLLSCLFSFECQFLLCCSYCALFLHFFVCTICSYMCILLYVVFVCLICLIELFCSYYGFFNILNVLHVLVLFFRLGFSHPFLEF